MEANPRAASPRRTSAMWRATATRVSMQPLERKDSPSSGRSCATTMMMDVADVKADTTGREMNSTRNPESTGEGEGKFPDKSALLFFSVTNTSTKLFVLRTKTLCLEGTIIIFLYVGYQFNAIHPARQSL